MQTTSGPVEASDGRGVGRDRGVGKDPGTPNRAILAWLVVLTLGTAVMVFQQLNALAGPPAKEVVPGASLTAPGVGDQAELASKMLVKLAEILPTDAKSRSSLANQSRNPAAASGNVERFRDVIVQAHLAGKDAWQAELDEITAPQVPWAFEGAAEDSDIVGKIMRGEAVDDAQRKRLADRHGFYGSLAGVLDKPAGDAQRDALLAGGGALIAVLVGIMLLVVSLFVLAMVCSVIAIAKLSARRVRWRMDVPTPGGSILIETVAVFVAGFFLLKIVLMVLEGALPKEQHAIIGPVGMGLQWCLLAVPLWGLARGVPWQQLRMLLGLHSGEGVLKEIGCGLFAYFAGLPLVLMGIVISLIAMLLQGLLQAAANKGAPTQPPENPIFELVSAGSTLQIVMLFALASIWAPLVEELVFRGAMFRHLRGRLGLLVSAAISAVMFAVMHGYPFFLLGPVMMLGLNFALMREWRGSLIGPMVMHCLHNATTLIVVLSLLKVMA